MAISMGRKAKELATAAVATVRPPAAPAPSIADRWLDERVARAQTETVEQVKAIVLAGYEQAMADGDELGLLEQLVPVYAPEWRLTGWHEDQARARLESPDAPFTPMSMDEELALRRLAAEAVPRHVTGVEVYQRDGEGDWRRVRETLIVDVGQRARLLLRLRETLADRRAMEARNRAETAERTRVDALALAGLQAELVEKGTWARILDAAPDTLDWLEDPARFRRFLNKRPETAGFDPQGTAAHLLRLAEEERAAKR
jgi:hypothetical protein